jgi:hypothetical protein
MKTPRVKDFDPDAIIPTLKSSMDNMPAIGKPKKVPPPLNTPSENQSDMLLSQPNQQTSQHLEPIAGQERAKSQSFQEIVTPRTPTISGKRAFIKRTFDLFEDQLSYLTKESLQDRLAGKEVSMNSMVREAIDDWIKKRQTEK